MLPRKPDHYVALGVFRDATQEEIKRAYLESARRLHPDKNVAAGETELFLAVQEAYEVLSNPKRRSLYDATLPPDITGNLDVKHEIIFSRPSLVNLSEPQLLYVLLEVSSREDPEKLPTPPLNICLIVDRSTSMQGEKLDVAKATAIQLLRSLRQEDTFSLIAFSDKAEVIIPAMDATDKKKQENSIQMMHTTGGTEIYQGLRAGIEEIHRAMTSARVNHMILLTDGQTYGDEQECLALAEEAATQGIGISGMGIGHEWNDIFLDALTSKTGGSSSYISKPKDIQRLLVEKFNALASIYADEVTLEFKEQEHIRINYAFRLQPEGGSISIEPTMRLGPILRDASLQILFEFIIEPAALIEDEIALMNGALKMFIAARSTPVPPIRLKISRRVEKEPSMEAPPVRILSALSRLTLYRMQERARLAADEGRFDAAATHLHNLATHLLSQGENSLAKTVLFEADNLESKRKWSAGESKKDIKYRTRALLMSSTKEKT